MSFIQEIDFNPIILLIIACETILYSCGSSENILFLQNVAKPSFLRVTDETKEEITTPIFFFMIISSSIVLLLIYYFMNYMFIVLKLLLLFSIFMSLSFVVWDWFCLVIPISKVCNILTIILSLSISLIWLKTEHWMITDFISFSLSVFAISFIKINKLQIVYLVGIGFLIYDVWWVFLSPSVFGESVMVKAASSSVIHLPISFSIPKEIATL